MTSIKFKTYRKNNFYLIWSSLLISVMVLLYACGEKESGTARQAAEPRPVKTRILKPVNAGFHKAYPGKAQAARKVNLAFRISGPLIEFPVNEGEIVPKDGVIAKIDPRDYKTTLRNIAGGLSEARANLAAMEKGARIEDVKALEAKVNAVKAKFVEASGHFQRAQKLYKENVLSKADFDRYVSARDVAKAELAAAGQELVKAKKGARKEDLDAMKSRIEGLIAKKIQAENALSDTVLKAPFTGVVTKKYVENYQDVMPKAPIVNLQDISSMEVAFDVPESEMAYFRNGGLSFEIAFENSHKDGFEATIKSVALDADPVTRTYEVELSFPPPSDAEVLPGMTATVYANEKIENNDLLAFAVPETAVFADVEGIPHVFVVDENEMTVSKREVTLGDFTDGKDCGNDAENGEGFSKILVLKGLKENERIVTAGARLLTEGQKIRLYQNDAGEGN